MVVFGQSGTSAPRKSSSFSRRASSKQGDRLERTLDTVEDMFSLEDGTCVKVVRYSARVKERWGRRKKPQVVFKKEQKVLLEQAVPVAVGNAFVKALSSRACLVSRKEVAALLKEVEEASVKKRMLTLLNKKDYATKMLKEKLLSDGYEASLVEDVLAKARKGRLLDDTRYAGSFIFAKARKGLSQTKIAKELEAQGIFAKDLLGWPEDFFEQSEKERAYAIASQKSFSEKNRYEKIVRFLVTKGYSYDIANSVARKLSV